LFTQAGLDYEAQTRAAARRGFKAVAMGLKIDAQIHNTIRRLSSANVIGLLPGAEHRHEYVVFAAHWDHLGRDSHGTIYNGAVDNATGVAGLLMLAQSFHRTRPPPDRSIVFIAFTAEESGLLGSAYYVENPVFPLRQTAGMLNLDGLHIGGRTRDVMVFGAGNSELEEYVRAGALLQGREVRPEPHPEQGLYFRSDQYNFARHGVPALYVSAGIDDAARGPAWGQAQLDDYMAHRYRQPSDKYAEDWDVRGAVEDLTLYYEIGDRLARTRRFPRWYPNSEFSGD
jgi:Zn-dependent M28 family amino/carboxypeptidase